MSVYLSQSRKDNIYILELSGVRGQIYAELDFSARKIKEISFTFKDGYAKFTNERILYHFGDHNCGYSLILDSRSYELDLATQSFEKVLSSWLDRLIGGDMKREDYAKLYDDLIDAFELSLKADSSFIYTIYHGVDACF